MSHELCDLDTAPALLQLVQVRPAGAVCAAFFVNFFVSSFRLSLIAVHAAGLSAAHMHQQPAYSAK